MGDIITSKCILCAVQTAGSDPDLPGVLRYMPPLRLEKLKRLKRREDRARSVCAELALQAAFALWGVPPIPYTTGENGRPMLAAPWDLSLSHGGELGVAALAKTPVGVDAEKRSRHFAGLRRKLCSPGEQDVPDARLAELWTAKEAYLKLTGEGLRIALHTLSAEGDRVFRDGKQAAVLTRFTEPEGYAVALATQIPVEAELHVLTMDAALQLIISKRKEPT